MSRQLTYTDFALDEFVYLQVSYNNGQRHNAMVSQAQRICECYLKQIIENSLANNDSVMMSHNLRSLYDYIANLGIDLRNIRADIMLLNNYYTHTRYPGRDAFMASNEDITAAYDAIVRIISFIQGRILNA